MKAFCTTSILATAILAASLSGCGEKPATAQAPPPPLVEFLNPVRDKIIIWDEYTGRFESTERVEVRARISGMLEKVHFTDGAIVKKGDVLFTIDSKPFKAELAAARADLIQAQAGRDLAKNNFERGQELLKRNAIASEEVDIRRGSFAAEEAKVQAAQARVESAQLNLDYTEVRAEISGRTSDHFVSEGNLISGGSAQSTLLTTIVTIDPIYCRIEADEASVLKYMRMNLAGERESARDADVAVQLGLADEDGFPHQGKLDFVNNSFDQATATMRARVTVSNKDELLTPGMFARVRLPGRGEFEATLVPELAIQSMQSLTFLLTLDEDDIIRSTVVKLGPSYGAMRVIESDLPLDTRVIVSGMVMARPGMPATAKPKATNPAAEASTKE
ncbi:efflux RND transporter periplasmic adaptor subunit [Verrucomicrobiaceae bacterium 227]